MIIGDWLGHREMLTPDKAALFNVAQAPHAPGARCELSPITYRAWNRIANRTARWLRDRLGVRRGDRVAVLSMNCVEVLDVWFACGKLGAVLQPLNWRLTPGELGALVAGGEPIALLYGRDFALQAEALRGSLASPLALAAIDADHLASPADPALREREHLDDAPLAPIDLTLDDPWLLCSTGGSTGAPKSAVLTHGNVTWNAVNTVMSWGLTQDDITILNAPLFHTGGLNVLTAPLVHVGGASIVCRSFDPDQVFDLLERGRVTVFFGVPTMFLALAQHPRFRGADLTRLRFVISGGAPCPPPIFEAFWERGVEFKTGYGLTEAGPNTFWLPSEYVRKKPGCVGAPLFHVEARVAPSGGQDREPGPDEVGELLIRGPHVFPGYFRRPEETARALEGGFLHTGDLARRDADGHFWIVGRLKDMIISGGENVYPAEVEAVLAAHPGVAEAALIGVPDPRWGEVGRAIVVPRPESAADQADLLAFCRARLAGYKTPKSVVYVDALPRTGAGKIDKRALVERYGGEIAPASAPPGAERP